MSDENADGGVPAGAVAGSGGDGAEVAEDRVQVVEYAAAIDVAKGFGMVCTRVPGSRADRRLQKVWRGGGTPPRGPPPGQRPRRPPPPRPPPPPPPPPSPPLFFTPPPPS